MRLLVIGLLLPVALVFIACPRSAAPPHRPAPALTHGVAAGRDVVLITLDTVRADRLGAYGSPRPGASPAMDALLARGARFAHATAPRAATWPSLGSVLTGLYPSGHGLIENGYSFADELDTLPEVLKRAGYRTGAFLSNMCQANHQGFDDLVCSGGQDGKTVDRALAWAQAPDASSPRPPTFLWVHLFGAHGPYYNGGNRGEKLDPGYQGPVAARKWALDRLMTERTPLTARDLIHLDAIYDAAVMGTDNHVGRLLAGLGLEPGSERSKRSVVILLADHGEELGRHNGYLYHACSVYQTTLHVPFGVVAEGVLPPGGTVSHLVELVDVTPTLLDLLGLDGPTALHGASLVPLLARADSARPGDFGNKPAFTEYSGNPIHTAQLGSWKVVLNPQGLSPDCIVGAPPGHYPIGKVELYDLAKDPDETQNLAKDNPAKVTELAALLERRFAGLSSRGRQEIDPKLKEELRALGYVAN
jgi:arylsulfatase A-like enzyme